MNLKQAVVFAILMENNGGIVEKSPTYIQEKLRMIELTNDDNYLISMLDKFNQEKFEQWCEQWQ